MKLNIVTIAAKRSMLILSTIFLSGLIACEKFVDTPIPSNRIAAISALKNDASLVSALSGCYNSVANNAISVVIYGSYFADDLSNPLASGNDQLALLNTYNPSAEYGFFRGYYTSIYNINLILDALSGPNTISPNVAAQVKGECKFLRAFCYYRLVNYYYNVPMVLTSDVSQSGEVANTPSSQTINQIITDLKDAKSLLSSDYPSSDRVRVNRHAVNSLLARIYLQNQDWVNAEAAASEVINSNLYALNTDLNKIFVKGSTETIWQLWNASGATNVGATFIPSSATTNAATQLRPELINAYDVADKRKAAWIKAGTYNGATVFYPFKYKQRAAITGADAEYLIQFRLAEQYLIRAEARAQQNNIGTPTTGGLGDLNMVNSRANTLLLTAADKLDLLPKIERERRLELMTEESLRWFDLNRTGRSAAVLSLLKPGFTAKAVLLPYSNDVLRISPFLKQNPSYNN